MNSFSHKAPYAIYYWCQPLLTAKKNGTKLARKHGHAAEAYIGLGFMCIDSFSDHYHSAAEFWRMVLINFIGSEYIQMNSGGLV